MKFLFIALVYFSVGFAFPELSRTLQYVLGGFFVLFTVGIMLTLFDDRFDEAAYE